MTSDPTKDACNHSNIDKYGQCEICGVWPVPTKDAEQPYWDANDAEWIVAKAREMQAALGKQQDEIARLTQERDEARRSAKTLQIEASRKDAHLRLEQNSHIRAAVFIEKRGLWTAFKEWLALNETASGQSATFKNTTNQEPAFVETAQAIMNAKPTPDDVERAREPIKDVGPDFSAFLRQEMSCEASCCHWEWFAEGHDNYVGCRACGSLYPWRDTYYLRRIFMAEARREGAELLSCGHAAANIGGTGLCEACQDIAAAREQGRSERQILDEAVVEAARETLKPGIEYDVTLRRMLLRDALATRDAFKEPK
jgi:hypothetical protein